MSCINYKPWVGKDYNKGYRGKRILVLGESHYAPDGKIDEELTQWVVRDIAYEPGGQNYLATFTCFERAIAGRQMTQAERVEFWARVIFSHSLTFLDFFLSTQKLSCLLIFLLKINTELSADTFLAVFIQNK